MFGAKLVGRHSGALCKAERLVQKGQSGLDAVQLIGGRCRARTGLPRARDRRSCRPRRARAPRSAVRGPGGARPGASACGRRRGGREPRAPERPSPALRGRATQTLRLPHRSSATSISASARASAPSRRAGARRWQHRSQENRGRPQALPQPTRSSRASGGSCHARSGRRIPSEALARELTLGEGLRPRGAAAAARPGEAHWGRQCGSGGGRRLES